MNFLSWNYRGFGNPLTVRELGRLARDKKPSIIFLMETKFTKEKFEKLRIWLRYFVVLGVSSLGRGGGLALL